MNAHSRAPIDILEHRANVKLWRAAMLRIILDEQRKYQAALRGKRMIKLDGGNRLATGSPDRMINDLRKYFHSADGQNLMACAEFHADIEQIIAFVKSDRKLRREVAADNLTIQRKNGRISA